ncbi:MAG: M14 family zinc carboxypeptidase [Pseudobdellovibrionaceae bacterium]
MYTFDMGLRYMNLQFLTQACLFLSAFAHAQDPRPLAAHQGTNQPTVTQIEASLADKNRPDSKLILKDLCVKQLSTFLGKNSEAKLVQACAEAKKLEVCQSHKGHPIFHYDKNSVAPEAKKILVFSLIHGDETDAGTVGRYWMERLHEISPRNNWRIVPMLNPDGVLLKTRTNANKIDLNRNFPTRDWDDKALHYWQAQTKSNPRRFPGSAAASESETKCALKHIEEYEPNFVISIHTPLNVLDYDGPKVKKPNYSYLPWHSLGHFPGSLGRYMWFERTVPVLTMELKDHMPKSYEPFEKLHDVIGQLVKYEIHSPQNKQTAN